MTTSHTFNHKQTPAASSLRCKVKAEQRVAGTRTIDLLPKYHSQNSQLFINCWYPSVVKFDGLLSTRECPRSHFQNLAKLIGASIMHEYVPYSIEGCCRKEEQPDPTGIEKSRHGRQRVTSDSTYQEDITRAMVMRESGIAISAVPRETY